MKVTGTSLEEILDRRIVWNKTNFNKTYVGDTTEVDTVPSLQDSILQLLAAQMLHFLL